MTYEIEENMSPRFINETSVDMGFKGKITPEVLKEAKSRIDVLETLRIEFDAQVDDYLNGAEQGLSFF